MPTAFFVDDEEEDEIEIEGKACRVLPAPSPTAAAPPPSSRHMTPASSTTPATVTCDRATGASGNKDRGPPPKKARAATGLPAHPPLSRTGVHQQSAAAAAAAAATVPPGALPGFGGLRGNNNICTGGYFAPLGVGGGARPGGQTARAPVPGAVPRPHRAPPLSPVPTAAPPQQHQAIGAGAILVPPGDVLGITIKASREGSCIVSWVAPASQFRPEDIILGLNGEALPLPSCFPPPPSCVEAWREMLHRGNGSLRVVHIYRPSMSYTLPAALRPGGCAPLTTIPPASRSPGNTAAQPPPAAAPAAEQNTQVQPRMQSPPQPVHPPRPTAPAARGSTPTTPPGAPRSEQAPTSEASAATDNPHDDDCAGHPGIGKEGDEDDGDKFVSDDTCTAPWMERAVCDVLLGEQGGDEEGTPAENSSPSNNRGRGEDKRQQPQQPQKRRIAQEDMARRRDYHRRSSSNNRPKLVRVMQVEKPPPAPLRCGNRDEDGGERRGASTSSSSRSNIIRSLLVSDGRTSMLVLLASSAYAPRQTIRPGRTVRIEGWTVSSVQCVNQLPLPDFISVGGGGGGGNSNKNASRIVLCLFVTGSVTSVGGGIGMAPIMGSNPAEDVHSSIQVRRILEALPSSAMPNKELLLRRLWRSTRDHLIQSVEEQEGVPKGGGADEAGSNNNDKNWTLCQRLLFVHLPPALANSGDGNNPSEGGSGPSSTLTSTRKGAKLPPPWPCVCFISADEMLERFREMGRCGSNRLPRNYVTELERQLMVQGQRRKCQVQLQQEQEEERVDNCPVLYLLGKKIPTEFRVIYWRDNLEQLKVKKFVKHLTEYRLQRDVGSFGDMNEFEYAVTCGLMLRFDEGGSATALEESVAAVSGGSEAGGVGTPSRSGSLGDQKRTNTSGTPTFGGHYLVNARCTAISEEEEPDIPDQLSTDDIQMADKQPSRPHSKDGSPGLVDNQSRAAVPGGMDDATNEKQVPNQNKRIRHGLPPWRGKRIRLERIPSPADTAAPDRILDIGLPTQNSNGNIAGQSQRQDGLDALARKCFGADDGHEERHRRNSIDHADRSHPEEEAAAAGVYAPQIRPKDGPHAGREESSDGNDEESELGAAGRSEIRAAEYGEVPTEGAAGAVANDGGRNRRNEGGEHGPAALDDGPGVAGGEPAALDASRDAADVSEVGVPAAAAPAAFAGPAAGNPVAGLSGDTGRSRRDRGSEKEAPNAAPIANGDEDVTPNPASAVAATGARDDRLSAADDDVADGTEQGLRGNQGEEEDEGEGGEVMHLPQLDELWWNDPWLALGGFSALLLASAWIGMRSLPYVFSFLHAEYSTIFQVGLALSIFCLGHYLGWPNLLLD